MDSDRVVNEYRDSTGCKTLFDRAGQGDRAAGYSHFLREVLERWPPPTVPLPLVISGMASSTIGWKELPYARVPFQLDGSSIQAELLSWECPSSVRETYLISGLAAEDDVMRGEETEAIGLLQGWQTSQAVLILPGTHSKHLLIRNNAIAGFTTYMTGELFEVLARSSILKATTDPAAAFDPRAFDEGVQRASRFGLPGSLFKTRVRSILDGASPQSNTWFLSGLLIGAELGELAEDSLIYIGGDPEIRRLYGRALKLISHSNHHWQELSSDLAVPKAHATFLRCLRSR